MTMNITELSGKRCLLQLPLGRFLTPGVSEYKVLEISPSGNHVKLMDMNGRKFWKATPEIAFVEELIDLRAARPKKDESFVEELADIPVPRSQDILGRTPK